MGGWPSAARRARPFGLLRRKHRCRACGKIVYGACSRGRRGGGLRRLEARVRRVLGGPRWSRGGVDARPVRAR